MSEQQPGKGGNLGSLPGGKIAQLNEEQPVIGSNLPQEYSLIVEFSWKTKYSTSLNYIGGFTLDLTGTKESREKFQEMSMNAELKTDALQFEQGLMTFSVPDASMPLNGLPAVGPSSSSLGIFRLVKGDLLVQSHRWAIVTRSIEVPELWFKAGSLKESDGSLELLDELNRLRGTVGVHQFWIDSEFVDNTTVE